MASSRANMRAFVSENEGPAGARRLGVKNTLGVSNLLPAKASRTTRPAMQELPVNVVQLKNETTNKVVKGEPAKPVAVKPTAVEAGVVKPPRMLAKYKGTVSLKNAVESSRVMPKRKSAEKQQQPPKPVEAPTRIMPKRRSTEKQQPKPEPEPEPMEISKQEIEDVEMADVDAVPANPFSANRLQMVDDIDEGDEADPQLVSEYVKEIYLYLRQLEKEQCIEKDYLGNNKGGIVLPKMRALLIDWIVEVHQQFSMLQETLYMTVAILDRYLQKEAAKINRKSIQLVGVAAMFIASKYEEIYTPEIGDFVYISDNAYTPAQIRQQEIEIFKVLNFDLGRPTPIQFLRRYSKAACVDTRVHALAKFIMELTILEYNFIHVAPSKIAAAALVISIKFFDDETAKSLKEHWTDTLAYYSQYEWSDIADVVEELLALAQKTCEARSNAKLMAIRTKYSNKKFGNIAVIAQRKMELFNEMRAAQFSTGVPM